MSPGPRPAPICRVVLAVVLAVGVAGARAADARQIGEPARLRVFIGCTACDVDFLRQEVTSVEYVRDRVAADVHVLFTTETTGSGGQAITLNFIGRGRFTGLDDSLIYVSSAIETADDTRRGYARLLSLGLVRYLARTPLAARLRVDVPADAPNLTGATAIPDPWNYWVFNLGVSGDVTGEALTRTWALSSSGTASRTTARWKLQFGASANYDSSRFELGDETLTTVSHNSLVDGLAVKSLGDHWGLGVGGSLVSSTFTNQRGTFRLASAIEFNVFPYAESSRQQVTFGYAVGVSSLRYREETIFGKLDETRPDGRFQFFAGATQPWGAIDVSVQAEHFLDAPSQQRVLTTGTLSLQVTGGLFLDTSGGASLLRDQVYLARRGASDEEVLLRQRRLATGYDYFLSLGVTFTFGSVHDSVVNSRFTGARCGFIRRY